MQLTSLFVLLPLLAAVSAFQQQPAATGTAAYAPGNEPTYRSDKDTGDYHDEPEHGEDDGKDEDETVYEAKPERRVEHATYKALPKQTVVIVVAKSQHSQTTTTTLTATGAGVKGQGEVRYVSPSGRPLTPATSPYMLAINRTFALRINTKENDHLKKNRVYPSRTKCLFVRRKGVHNRWKARVERCSDEQYFRLRSPASFHFEAAAKETVRLVWMDPKGVKRCAHHDDTGTRFYPCDDKSITPTRYVVLPTAYPDKFKIKEHDRNRCFDGDHDNLWMNRCRGFEDQAWDFITIAYNQY